jgi:hypothetical protein
VTSTRSTLTLAWIAVLALMLALWVLSLQVSNSNIRKIKSAAGAKLCRRFFYHVPYFGIKDNYLCIKVKYDDAVSETGRRPLY